MTTIPEDGGRWPDLFSLSQIADALGETPDVIEDMLDCVIFGRVRHADAATPADACALPPAARASLAIVHALWRGAGLSPAAGAAVLSCRPEIAASIGRITDFFSGGEEEDPFLFFCPVAVDAIPVAAVDQYLDVIDGRHVLWRRPEQDPERIAEAIVESEARLRQDPTDPEARDVFLATAARLTEPACHARIWLGRFEDGTFVPMSDEDRGGEGLCASPRAAEASLESCYGSKVSVNLSLAARNFKRRLLGLDVTGPAAAIPHFASAYPAAGEGVRAGR